MKWATVFAVLTVIVSVSSAANSDESREILPGAATDVTIPADSAATFRVTVPEHAALDLTLIQRAGFVDLELRNESEPDHAYGLRTESGTTGAADVPLLASTSVHWLVNLKTRPGKGAATAVLRLSDAHPATSSDTLRGSAFAHYVEAEQLRFLNYRESAVTKRAGDTDERTRSAYAAATSDYAAAADGCGVRHAQIGLARMEVALGNYAQASAAADQALRASCDAELAERAQALKTLGMAAAYQGDYIASAAAAEQALALYRQTGDVRYQGIVLGNLSDVYMQLGATERALDAANGALQAAESTADPSGVVFSHESIGAIHLARGELAAALQAYRRSQTDLSVTAYPMIEGETWNDLGIVYHRMADYEQSLQAYASAQAVWKKMNNRFGHADTLINQAELLLELGHSRGALLDFDAALAIARADNLKGVQTGALRGLGMAYGKLGDASAARSFIMQSLALARVSGELAPQAYALRALAAIDQREGHAAAALRDAEEALRLARAAADRDGEAATLEQLARLHAESGDLDAGLELVKRALDIIETQRGQINDPSLRTSYFASVRAFPDTQIDILMRLAERAPRGGYERAALAAAERARARSLEDMLAEKAVDVSRTVDPAMIRAEHDAEERVSTAAFQLSRQSARASAERRQALADELDAASRGLDVIRGQIRSSNPRYADLVRPVDVRVEDLQQSLLDDDSAILEYWLGRRASYVWIVTRHSFRALRLPRRAVIERQSEALVALCRERLRTPPSQGFAALAGAEAQRSAAIGRAAYALARSLFGADVLRGLPRRLAIVADAGLQGVPFELLPNMLTRGVQTRGVQTLGAAHDLAYLPSITTSEWLRRRPTDHDARAVALAVFADPLRGPSDLPPLPYARVEAEDIAALLPKDQVWLALGAEASRAAVLATDWRRFTIAHFAAHALVDLRRPELSGIVLSSSDAAGVAQDGVLRMNDIYNLDMPVDLVVLSGCETAAGRGLESEGVFSLSRAFFYAGASRVIASLWPVDDRATAAFMQEFYRALLVEHMTPASALRSARRLVAGDSRWASPYYWAGFVLEGDWH